MIVAKLQLAGFNSTEGKVYNTEIWSNPETGKELTIKKLSDNYPDEILLEIITKAGLTPEQFHEL